MAETSSTEYRSVIERYLAAFNDHDPDALGETVTEDVVVHGLIGVEGTVTGRDEYVEWGLELLAGIPDARIELEAYFETNDMVMARWTVSGIQEDELFGLPATGEYFEIPGLAMFRMDDGKIAEKWYQQDDLGMLQQTGVIDDL